MFTEYARKLYRERRKDGMSPVTRCSLCPVIWEFVSMATALEAVMSIRALRSNNTAGAIRGESFRIYEECIVQLIKMQGN